MDWNRVQNHNVGHVRSERQQYLLPTVSAAGPSTQNQAICASQNRYSHGVRNGGELFSSKMAQDPLLKNLLKAQTSDDFLKVQHSILSSTTNGSPNQCHETQGSMVQYNAPYKHFPDTTNGSIPTSAEYRNSQNIQQMATAAYRAHNYTNSVPQQFNTVRTTSNYEGKGYSARDVPSAPQTYRAICSSGNSQHRVQQHVQSVDPCPPYPSKRQTVKPSLQVSYRPMVQAKLHAPPQTTYDLQNGVAQQRKRQSSFDSSLVVKNVSECVQSQQPHLMQSCQNSVLMGLGWNENPSEKSFSQNTCTTAFQMQPEGNSTSCLNVQIEPFLNQSQSGTLQDMHQRTELALVGLPDQCLDAPQLQSCGGALSDNTNARVQLLLLLSIYKNVKANILSLARESNYRTQNIMQSSSNASHESSNVNSITSSNSCAIVPSLTSSIQTASMVTNDRTLDQQKALQANSFQMSSSDQMNSIKPQGAYVNNYHVAINRDAVQQVLSQESPSQVGSTNGRAILSQDSASVFNGGQINSLYNMGYNPSQAIGSGSTKEKEIQESSFEASIVHLTHNAQVIPSNVSLPVGENFLSKQYISNSNHSNGSLPQHGGLLQRDNLCSDSPHHSGPFNANVNFSQRNGPLPTIASQSVNPNSFLDVKDSSPITENTLNDPDVNSSLEVLDTCLALWKAKSQNATTSVSEHVLTERKQTSTELSDQSRTNLMKELNMRPFVSTNEVTLPSSGMSDGLKQDTMAPNVLKGVEPQIAIVSPLIQSKVIHVESQSPKIEQCPVIQEGSICSLIQATKEKIMDYVASIKDINTENVCLDKLKKSPEKGNELECIKSTLALEKGSSEEITPPLHCDSGNEALEPKSSITPPALGSQNELDMQSLSSSSGNITQNEDSNLQIFGICSLAEGSTFYNSSIAMMFDKDSLQPEGNSMLPKKDVALSDEYKLLNCLEIENASTTEIRNEASLKQKPEQSEVESSFHANLSETDSSVQLVNAECSQVLDSQDYSKSNQNKMSTVNIDHEPGSPPCASDQLSELLTEYPFGIKNYTLETHLETGEMSTEKITGASLEERSSTPIEDPLACPENVCDSPANIQITVLGPEEMSKHFPDLKGSEFLPNSVQTDEVDICQEAVCAVESQTQIAESSTTKEVPDKDLFCCLYSWLTHHYKSAPKCLCKLPEDKKVKLTSVESMHYKESDLPSTMTVESSESGLKIAVSKSCPSEYLSVGDCSQLSPSSSHGKAVKEGNDKRSPEEKSTEHRLQESFSQNKSKLPKSKSKSKAEKLKRTASFSGEPNLKCSQKSNTLYSLNSVQDVLSQSGLPTKKSRREHATTTSNKVAASEKFIVKTDFLKHKPGQRAKCSKDINAELHQSQSGSGHGLHNGASNVTTKCLDGTELSKTSEISNKEKQPSPKVEQNKLVANGALIPNEPSLNLERSSQLFAGSKRKHEEIHLNSTGQDHKSLAQKPRKVLTVQEYLNRRKLRDGSSKRDEIKLMEVWETSEKKQTLPEKHRVSTSGTGLWRNTIKMRKSSANPKNMTLKTSKEHSGAPKGFHLLKDRTRTNMSYGGKPSKKSKEMKTSNSSKDKIYLSPCVAFRHTSHEGINLTKLEIRPAPEPSGYKKRRKSLEPKTQIKPSNPTVQKPDEKPKMLEFKLFPELLQKSHSMGKMESKLADKETSIVEGIKSKKEAWYKDIPLKKRKLHILEDQGIPISLDLTGQIPTSTTENDALRQQSQDSKATFDTYKKMYLEKRSKSLDSSLTH
ncbi:retroelement silencing factor 1 [Ascaphus truei]|uniref:retroelement silencing factor 1 n=1 Tax=Ascaphus truei TaxID=8439 RepID=UPI003F59416A